MSQMRWHDAASTGAHVSWDIPRVGSLASVLGTWRNRNFGTVTLEVWTRGPLLDTPRGVQDEGTRKVVILQRKLGCCQ